jgi:hypothetical protein
MLVPGMREQEVCHVDMVEGVVVLQAAELK